MANKEPKILILDYEISPTLAWVYGIYDTNVIQVEREWHLMTVGYKWLHQDKIHAKSLPDFNRYKYSKTDDKQLTKFSWELTNEADIIIAYNGDRFDIKKANSRFLYHELEPPSDYQTIDPLKIMRKKFGLNSNKMDDVAQYMGIERKKQTSKGLWIRCIKGDKDAWEEMNEYCKQDVYILEQVYKTLLPWIDNHPNVALMSEVNGCPACGSQDYKKSGFRYTRTTKRQRYKCNECNHRFTSRKSEPLRVSYK